MNVRTMPVAGILFGLAVACYAGHAAAQVFPSKPVRIIVPYSAGGAVDVTARAIGTHLAERLGQSIVIDNRPGASSTIGMTACSKAEPDGHTLCMTVADSLSLNPHLFRSLPYDPDTDFAPVIYLVRGYSLLFAKADAPFNSIGQMIDYARANPGKLNWATWGPASIPDVYLRWIAYHGGVKFTPIPYKGVAPATAAVLTGESDVTYHLIGAVLPHIRAEKLKPLAIVGGQRSSLLPDVPSLVEAGVDPGLRSYFGVFAPPKTPRAVIDRLNAEFAKAAQEPRFQDFARSRTLDVVGGSAAEFAEFLRNDRANAGRVFRAIGVQPVDAPS